MSGPDKVSSRDIDTVEVLVTNCIINRDNVLWIWTLVGNIVPVSVAV